MNCKEKLKTALIVEEASFDCYFIDCSMLRRLPFVYIAEQCEYNVLIAVSYVVPLVTLLPLMKYGAL